MRVYWLILIAAVLCVAGCEKKADTQKETLESAERSAKLGKFSEAIRLYEASLDGTAKTADLHYRIAMIYDDKLKAQLDAIHHYDRYIELAPSGPRVADAKKARAECSKELQTKLNRDGFLPQSQAVAMRRQNEELRADVVRLAGILGDHKIPFKKIPLPPPVSAEQAAKGALPPGTREYTVKSGDTLASIARAFYKNAALSDHIKDANQVQLKGTDKINIGMVLIIPDRPGR